MNQAPNHRMPHGQNNGQNFEQSMMNQVIDIIKFYSFFYFSLSSKSKIGKFLKIKVISKNSIYTPKLCFY